MGPDHAPWAVPLGRRSGASQAIVGLSSVTVSSGPLPRLYTTGAMHVKLSQGKSMCYVITVII